MQLQFPPSLKACTLSIRHPLSTAVEIRLCKPADFDEICAVVNDAAVAYRGIIAADRWKDPYMPPRELRDEMNDGVVFWGAFEEGRLVGVMGLQQVKDIALIRHAYTCTASQGRGVGTALLAHVGGQTDRPTLIGTWAAASWAIRFYQRHGFRLVTEADKEVLLRRYWEIPERQIEESVVLGDARWFAKSSFALRAATPEDAAAIAILLAELGYPTDAADAPRRLAAVVADGGALLLAVRDDGPPLGLMCLSRHVAIHADSPVAYITALVTTSAARRRGVGRALVEEAKRWAREQGCGRLSVTSAEHRADAHAFYPSCGMPYTGRRFSVSLEAPRT